ncbi:MAG: hypothetical protein MSG64_13235 [Pyrinomonadaceae bacterium MAG19_C2-C3]|nr:hypothetical protein [Pyrinomonadaceae bacterium MAG19_C2-C3]
MTIATIKNRLSIGNVVRNAVVFNFKKWRDNAVNSDNLLQSVDRLFTLLDERQVDYLLVGGIALLQYIEGRNTEDIDLIMALSSLEQLPEISIISRDSDFIRGKLGGLQIDILLTENPLFARVQQAYSARGQFLERTIPCATVEGLIVLKLYALPSLYRQGNFARVNLYENDVATLLYDYRPDVEPLFEVLATHVSDSDLVSLKEIVAEMQQRIERFGKEFE